MRLTRHLACSHISMPSPQISTGPSGIFTLAMPLKFRVIRWTPHRVPPPTSRQPILDSQYVLTIRREVNTPEWTTIHTKDMHTSPRPVVAFRNLEYYLYDSNVSAARLMAAVTAAICLLKRFASFLSIASFTPGTTTAAYPVYSPGA
jgi:hypothetical protein